MKQYGIALHNYHDTNESFPAAKSQHPKIEPASSDNWYAGWSCHFMLLPFMEETSRYVTLLQMDTTIMSNPCRIITTTQESYLLTPNTLRCPSDGNSKNYSFHNTDSQRRLPQCNIVLSHGDGMWDSERDYGSNPTIPASTNDNVSERGMFNCRLWKGMNACNDGTSNTIAVSEAAVSQSEVNDTVLGGVRVFSSAFHNNATTRLTCLNGRNGSMLTGTIASNYLQRGASWMAGYICSNGFHTVHPPNTPNCTRYDGGFTGYGLYPPSAYHAGGVNTAYFDGSTHFISETIDFGFSTAIQVLSGESQFGVWGALGTPDGGESKKL